MLCHVESMYKTFTAMMAPDKVLMLTVLLDCLNLFTDRALNKTSSATIAIM